MKTKRLYYNDSYLLSFDARLVRQELRENGAAVVLDESAFYPTSGGQPHDQGSINGVPIIDVVDEGEEVIHILKQPLPHDTTIVECRIDWARRFDHMQQHAGQHILSACFEQLFDAETVGFHLGQEVVTVDIAKDSLSKEEADQVENMANDNIYANKEIKAYFVEQEDVPSIPLRKPPTVTENIRIVEVDEFDYSACGGTHPARTGEIGMIKIRRWEKSRGNLRVEFVCGGA